VTYIVEREHSAEAVEELWANLRARCAPAVASRFGGWTGTKPGCERRQDQGRWGYQLRRFLRCGRGRILGCPVLTGDREFVTLEAARIVVHWLLSPV
jgi:hypothetical protein